MIFSFLSRLNKREKLVFYSAGLFVVLAVMDRIVVGPIVSNLKNLDEQIATRLALIEKNTRIVAERERVAEAREALAHFSRKAGTQEEEVAFLLGEVEQMARQASLYIIDMKPLGLQEDGVTLKYAVDLNCEATVEQIVEFMHDVESASLLLTVETFNITPKSKDSSLARSSMRISHVIFL